MFKEFRLCLYYFICVVSLDLGFDLLDGLLDEVAILEDKLLLDDFVKPFEEVEPLGGEVDVFDDIYHF